MRKIFQIIMLLIAIMISAAIGCKTNQQASSTQESTNNIEYSSYEQIDSSESSSESNFDSSEDNSIDEVEEITVTFQNYDGSILDTIILNKGNTIIYEGPVPQKNKEGYTYTFLGWTDGINEIVTILPTAIIDITYTAVFNESINTYTITWITQDGTELKKDNTVTHGSIPLYGDELPTKTDGKEKYNFFTWTPQILPATEDAVYTANFIEDDIEYSDFGAVGDGLTDDFEALYKAHVYANTTGASKVIAQNGRTYFICNTVPSKKLIEWANGIISGTHETSNNSNCIYGRNVIHINSNGLYTDCHGNIITESLKTWISENFHILERHEAITIPIMTDTDWSNAKFIIDDTNIATRIVSGTKVIAPSDIQYSKDIFSVIDSSQYRKTESFTTNQYSIDFTDLEFNNLLESTKLSTPNLYAINKQIQTIGIGPNTTKLNVTLGHSAMVILYNENLTTTAERMIAGTSNIVSPQNVYIRYGSNANSGSAKKETILIDANGNIDSSTPIIFDYTRITKVVICDIEIPTITLSGGEFTTMASRFDALFSVNNDGTINHTGSAYSFSGVYIRRGLNITRCNTVLEGIKHYVTNEFSFKEQNDGLQGAHYSGFYNLSNCSNILIKDCVLTGRRFYNISGTYDFTADTTCNIYLKNCSQSNFWVVENDDGTLTNATQNTPNAVLGMTPSAKYSFSQSKLWGVCGTNWCKNMEYDQCTLSRFDAHQGLYNGKITNSIINSISITGGGDMIVENTKVFPIWIDSFVIELRSDYGSTWNGNIKLKNVDVTVRDSNVTAVSLINFKYQNHYFGYQCYLPNISVENFNITNPENINNVYIYATTSAYSDCMHNKTLTNGETNKNVIIMPYFAMLDDINKYNYSLCKVKSCLDVGNSMYNVSFIIGKTLENDKELAENEFENVEQWWQTV